MLKVTEDISTTKKRLTIEIPAAVVEGEIAKGLQAARQQANLPGFRPGKAPLTIIEKKFGKSVENDVLEKLVPEYYRAALKEAGVTPVAQPEMEEGIEIRRNEPVTMTLTVEIRPKIEGLSYEGIAVKEVPFEVADADIDTVVRNLAEERGNYEAVEDSVAQGDLVTVDYTTEEGVEAKDAIMKVGSGPYPKEFFDSMVGKKKGEPFTVSAAFPADSPTQFAGKTPTFSMSLKDIKRRNMPVIDDEFAKTLGLESLQALRDRVRENLVAAKKADADRKKQLEIVEKLLTTHSFDVPEGLVARELDRMMGEAQAAGKQEINPEEFGREYRPKAERSVRASILLDIIGEKEGVQVSEEEIKEEVMAISQRYYLAPENVIKYYVTRDGSLEGLRNGIFERKTLKVLLDKAKTE